MKIIYKEIPYVLTDGTICHSLSVTLPNGTVYAVGEILGIKEITKIKKIDDQSFYLYLSLSHGIDLDGSCEIIRV